MNITIFGATGKTGMYVLRETLNRGHTVTVFVRTPTKLAEYQSKVKIVQGDVLEPSKILLAIQGADAVISCLGHVKGSQSGFQTTAIRNIVHAMQQAGVKRLVDLTGNGVFAPGDHPKLIDKLMTKMLSIVAKARVEDGTSHAAVITASNLDWTIVRTPVQLNSEDKNYKVGMVGDSQLALTAPRAAIAKFMIDVIEQGIYIKKLPVVTR